MSIRLKRVALLLPVILLASTLPLSHSLAAGTIVRLIPASQSIAVAQVTTLTVQAENVDNLYGYQVAIVFNPTVLEVVDADAAKPGIQVALGSFVKPDFVQQNSADNSVGAIICVVTQIAPTPAVNGTGDLLTISFRGKAQGISTVFFTDTTLARGDGTEIPATQESAQIIVGAVTQPTPTNTPTPTGTFVVPTSTPVIGPTPGQTIIYVVRSGDTLYSIARRFGVSLQALMQINGITDPSYIQVGQQLLIPQGLVFTPTPPVPAATPFVYIVQPGDTLYSIARRYGTTVYTLAVVNHIANPALIFAGQALVIPGGIPPVPPPPVRIHVVQPGETLFSIARRYGTTVWAIAMANHLYNPNVIYAGQTLVIP
jgi:LysM repeat protein